MEFSLNIIFFLAYPLAVCGKLCSVCRFKSFDDADTTSTSCYQSVNTVRLLQQRASYHRATPPRVNRLTV